MFESQKKAALRAIAGQGEEDSTLSFYLDQARDLILNRLYPYMDSEEYSEAFMPTKYDHKQVQIAAFLMNKRGAEGETRHIENGINRSYKGAYVPEDMLRDVMPYIGTIR